MQKSKMFLWAHACAHHLIRSKILKFPSPHFANFRLHAISIYFVFKIIHNSNQSTNDRLKYALINKSNIFFDTHFTNILRNFQGKSVRKCVKQKIKRKKQHLHIAHK